MKQKAFAVCVVILMLCMTSAVYAVDEAAGDTELLIARTLTKIVTIIVPSMLASIFIAATGYWKNNEGNFSLAKFLYTLFLATIVGGVTSYAGWTETQSITWFANTGLTIPLYWLAQGISARWGNYLPWFKSKEEEAK